MNNAFQPLLLCSLLETHVEAVSAAQVEEDED
jgi:hypothetical protein